MPVRNYSLVSQASIQILTVNPSKRIVEGSLPDKSKVALPVWNVPPAFRWPKVGEIWSIHREAGKPWCLGNRAIDISTLATDSFLLDGDQIIDSQGRRVPVKKTFTLDAITAGTPILLSHNLGTQDVCVSIYTIATGEVVSAGLAFIDTNTVQVTFANSYPANTYRVVIIG